MESGKVEKATLDCSSSKEYDRWHIALLFGGFLRAETEEEMIRIRRLSHLTKYIFPINLFGPAEDEPRYALHKFIKYAHFHLQSLDSNFNTHLILVFLAVAFVLLVTPF